MITDTYINVQKVRAIHVDGEVNVRTSWGVAEDAEPVCLTFRPRAENALDKMEKAAIAAHRAGKTRKLR
jgi:hypothetical protein